MNLVDFQEHTNSLNLESNLASLRIEVLNEWIYYKQEEEISDCDYRIPYEERDPEINEQDYYEWFSLSNTVMKNLSNSMGWDFKKLSENKEAKYSYLADCHYIPFDIYDVFRNVEKCSDVDFFFAMVTLVGSLGNRTKLEKMMRRTVKRSAVKYKLGELYKVIGESNTVFIAMSFSDEMKKARQVYQKVLVDMGYQPVLIDEVEHSNFIVPEILLEIEKCKFAIVDVTQHRNGVYFEAGYAKALRKPVIFTCLEEDFENAHFDIKQVNHILWTDVSDLETRLYKRLEVELI